MSAPVSVLVVDDSPFVRRAFRRVLGAVDDVRVVGEASDGEEALAQVRALRPSVVVLDLGMPKLGGLDALKLMRAERPAPAVLVVSASAQQGAEVTLAALEAGAFDFIDKAQVGSMQVHELGGLLIEKIRAASLNAPAEHVWQLKAEPPHEPPEVLVLGASTGGPMALRALLHALPPELEVPVALVQHMPASFLDALAERLGTRARPSQVAQYGQRLERNNVYVMPGGGNGCLLRSGEGLRVVQRRPEPWQAHVPAVDALFTSAAECCGPRAWSALLTGMGTDGAAGMLAIRRAGGLTVAQDAASSAVFGMPRAAIELGAASAVMPLHAIAPFFKQHLRSKGASTEAVEVAEVVVQLAPVGADEGSNA